MWITNILMAAAIGGIFTGIVIPIANYFIPRLFNKYKVKIILENPRNESKYIVYNLRIQNHSFATLKNVYAHVTIDNDKNDIIKERIQIFCSDSKVEAGMLSWSKNIDKKNYPNIDINQGESPDLNFIRFHTDNPKDAIEIASEQGFFDEQMNTKARIVLKANRNFKFQILFSGDNLWPIKRKYIFDNSKRLVTEGRS